MKALLLICLALLLLGCGGLSRSADPVAVYQYGDEDKSCEVLQGDLQRSLSRLEVLRQRRTTKIAANAMLTGTGVLLFPPLLLGLDLSDVDLTNIKAEHKRYNALAQFARNKKCGFDIEPLPPLKTKKAKPIMAVSEQH